MKACGSAVLGRSGSGGSSAVARSSAVSGAAGGDAQGAGRAARASRRRVARRPARPRVGRPAPPASRASSGASGTGRTKSKDQARDRQPRIGLEAVERRGDEGGRGAAVHRARVPGPAAELGGDEAAGAVGREDVVGHALTRADRRRRRVSASGSRSGGPWPKQMSAGRSSARRRAESRLRAGSMLKPAGGSCRPAPAGGQVHAVEHVAGDQHAVGLAPQRDVPDRVTGRVAAP